jgi:hypothetical protein
MRSIKLTIVLKQKFLLWVMAPLPLLLARMTLVIIAVTPSSFSDRDILRIKKSTLLKKIGRYFSLSYLGMGRHFSIHQK